MKCFAKITVEMIDDAIMKSHRSNWRDKMNYRTFEFFGYRILNYDNFDWREFTRTLERTNQLAKFYFYYISK